MADAERDNQASAGDKRVSRNPNRPTTTAAKNNTPKSNLDFVPFRTLLCAFASLSFHSASLHVDQFENLGDLVREVGPSPICVNCDVYDWKQVVSQANISSFCDFANLTDGM